MKTAIAVIFLGCAAALVSLHFFSSLAGTDFPDFYCAARILLDGHGRQLYDPALQYRYQATYAGRVGTLYIHPPFEVFYLTVAWLPLRYAYIFWSVLNLLFLGIAARTLAKTALPAWDWQLLAIFSPAFVPFVLCLIQGQDSIVLLLLIVLAYTNLRRGCNLASGCWLALGLFKFQLVLPIAIVLLLARNDIGKAFASGFAIVTFALMGLSAALSGWQVFVVYPKFLANLPAQHFAGIIPQAMPNFRGLAFTIFHDNRSPMSVAFVCALSAVALFYTVNAWKGVDFASDQQVRGTFDAAFSMTVMFALLVSYHLNPHDLTLLLLPVSLTLYQVFAEKRRRRIADWTALILPALLFLPPLHLLALKANLYPYSLIAIPLIMLWAAIGFMLGESRTPETALNVNNR